MNIKNEKELFDSPEKALATINLIQYSMKDPNSKEHSFPPETIMFMEIMANYLKQLIDTKAELAQLKLDFGVNDYGWEEKFDNGRNIDGETPGTN